jgi:RNA polymerase sigma factor (sigma-70 family)
MEASALRQMRVGGGSARPRMPLLRMQSDERLVGLLRRGNQAAFGVLVSRYEVRLLAFCRHLLRSREDAEDVLQEVFTSAYKAMLADDRPIKVRPWLYRIARNRCLNHLRRITAIGVDSIEDHFSEHGPSTSDTFQRREDLWQLVGDIQQLPESQRSALLLREMEALSYEQIAEVMDKTIPSVKSLLIRARRALAESAEARALTCAEAMAEIGDCHLGRHARVSKVVRRHIGECRRCAQLTLPEESTSAVRAWVLGPLAPLLLARRLVLSHLLPSGSAGSTATATAATAAGAGAAAGQSAVGGSAVAGVVSAGIGGVAGKAAVGLTAAALGVAGAVVADGHAPRHVAPRPVTAARVALAAPSTGSGGAGLITGSTRTVTHATHAAARQTIAPPFGPNTAEVSNDPTASAASTHHAKQATTTTPASPTGTIAAGKTTSAPTGGVAPTAQSGIGTPATAATPTTATTPTTTATTPTSTTPTTTTPTSTTTETTTSTTPTDTTPTGTTPTTGTSTTATDPTTTDP